MNLKNFYNSFIKIANIVKYSDMNHINLELNLKNASNESIKKMDMIAHDAIVKSLENIENIVGYISEESEDVVLFNKDSPTNEEYIMSFDPIDGSKNILSNITVGTIFCLYKYNRKEHSLDSVVEAGYCLYGPRITLVRTEGDKVQQLLLNERNEYVFEKYLSFNNNNEKLYSINESYNFSPEIKSLLAYYKANNYNQRWVGSMVADCHQVLSKGGLFIYPNSEKYPEGKLRLLYEVIPFSYIFKMAGGIGVDDNYNSILDRYSTYKLNKNNLHKSVPIILSSKIENERMISYLETRENIFC